MSMERAFSHARGVRSKRRPVCNLGHFILSEANLDPSYAAYAGYRWRDVHEAFDIISNRFHVHKKIRKAPSGRPSTSVNVSFAALAVRLNGQTMSERLGGLGPRAKQISHLCNNPLCYEPDHLWYETAEANLARNVCRNRMTAMVDGTDVGMPLCPHATETSPACVITAQRMVRRMWYEDDGELSSGTTLMVPRGTTSARSSGKNV